MLIGIDIGSTTTKIAAVSEKDHTILYYDYQRHGSAQKKSVIRALEKLQKHFPNHKIRAAFTGSGAKPVADQTGDPFIQEIVANSLALERMYDRVGTAVELGGQDAKMLFFRKQEEGEALQVADMRMNGSCAGGTGAFIDEVASILNVDIRDFNGLAEKGNCVYDISGRCGVFAKTDIQPLLNQGVSKENLALSAFHAIAKQTIGGLAQGLDIESPVVFEGGPLTFNPELIHVFAGRLGLSEKDILIPDHPEITVAYGAALSLAGMFADRTDYRTIMEIRDHLAGSKGESRDPVQTGRLFFDGEEEKKAFRNRHRKRTIRSFEPEKGEKIRAFLGIDSGSTTTKFVLMNEQEELLDSFYSSNKGNPLMVARQALINLRERYRKAGAELEILAAGSTGYGELLFHKAWNTETHVVETVAHARAAEKYVKDASFLLDIGGQDMKAIWLDHGIITNIVVNEACSSGCGSFLENFAQNLETPVREIAEAAFSSENPAVLGSRCTVFMNSSIITEQRNGKSPADIMAGLCRSIIENVFTKVIRISNLTSLGDRIVVQGGTFENDAVLRAMEQYVGRQVTRAPYPGIMGAIGAALITKEEYQAAQEENYHTFIGLDGLDDFSFSQDANSPCPFCANHCKRTIIHFNNGKSWVTNNRCERGEILGDPRDEEVRRMLKEKEKDRSRVPNLYRLREKLLFKRYDCPTILPARDIRIGLPRVLAYWDNMPFWSTFFGSLGFEVLISPSSTRKIYEKGLSAIPSDTVCFPAKLVHGHLRWLAEKGADCIFMPSITTIPSENTEKTSVSMCAVVKGYPIVIGNSDNPEKKYQVSFEAPLFHWYSEKDRRRQMIQYMEERWDIGKEAVIEALKAGDRAQASFRRQLQKAGEKVIRHARENDTYAVVLASRPYQNDALVNHDLPELFTHMGIPVLTADSVPGIGDTDLQKTRIDVVNNYHARMLSSAVIAARNPHLEYVQVVSFGCGHDAYLSDEIIRLMREISGKTPLVLKLDESDVQGPLRIRVRSFVTTIEMTRKKKEALTISRLPDPYPVKFTKADKVKTVLVPNTSHAFARLLSAAMKSQKLRTEAMQVGREEAIRLGKQYVHNDICFPAQIVIGEALEALKSGKYDPDHTAVAMGKYIGDCRLTHYGALLRKALDDAGFPQVPILTNDDQDYHDVHPGYKMNLISGSRIAFGLPMIDTMEELLRKIRPYELEPGSTDRAFEHGMDQIIDGMEKGGIAGAKKGFEKAIEIMKKIPYDRSVEKPTVLIVGEYLLNFHPGANREIERYLESSGLEIIEAKMTDVIRKSYYYKDKQVQEYKVTLPFATRMTNHICNQVFEYAHNLTDKIAARHPLHEKATRMDQLAQTSDPIIHHTFDAGEGILIPGEILECARKGCRNFIILQPFGCLPNHVVGRGISKKLKEIYPDARILPLDYDPDISFANIENRLQMLIMNAKMGQ